MHQSKLFSRLSVCVLAAATVWTTPTVSHGQTPQSGMESPSDVPNASSKGMQHFNAKHYPSVPGIADYPAHQKTFGNPSRMMDCRNNGDCEASTLNRWKRSMQASHWGYPEYFHRNTFGYANRNAFASNIRDGAIERSALYLLDFYPEDSPYAHMLTPKGLERLEKSLCIGSEIGSPIRIEKSARPELNELRREWLAEHPSVIAAGIDPTNIVLVSKPIGIAASEAITRYQRGLSTSSSPSSGAPSVAAPGGMLQGAGVSTGTPSIR